MSIRNRKVVEEPEYPVAKIVYPESDGEPMAETDLHIQLILDLRFVLREFFRTEERIYVGSNLLLYYVEGDPTKSVAPDLFVVRGVGKHDRRTYQLWEEGQAPNVVIEISSRKTKDDDLKWKKQLYGWLGVREYFIFDPEYKLKPALRAYRLHNGHFVEEAVTGGRVKSEELGLELVNTGKTLRLFNSQSNSYLLTPEEEAAARRQAEAEIAQLRAELERLKGSTQKPRGK
jgi:Uma2 family endonuclease